MIFGGLTKLTVQDYPGKVACIVFTVGCNFRCPYCHNSGLVNANESTIEESAILEFLKSRVGKLDGVCVSGGEPTIHKDLPDFISKVKDLGFSVKLDTNGTNPAMLLELILSGKIDYVAMDIKSSFDNYSIACGKYVNINDIKKSIRLIINTGIDHEFRTTVANGCVTLDDILQISNMIDKNDKYFIQKFVDSGKILTNGNFEVSDSFMLDCQDAARRFVKNTTIR